MAINNPLISGDPYSYDLKWMVKKIKSLVLQGESLEAALEALRSYVDQRFDTLDIQTEVNNKLNAMYEDGSLARLIARYLDMNTPQLYGAEGDGEHDDTEAIQAAIDSGYPVFFPNGKYLISDTLKVTKSNTRIYGAIDSAIIMGDELKRGNDAEWAMKIYSNAESYKKLVTSAITDGGTTFTVANSDDLTAGMIAAIKGDFSTSPWTSDNRGYIVKGETNIADKISGNTITLNIPASIPFTSSEIVTATFIEPIKNVRVENMHFIGKETADDKRQYRGVTIVNGVDCVITGCTADNCGINAIELNSSVFSVITDCIVNKAWSYEEGSTTVIGLGYALRDNAGNSNRIENSIVSSARHGVDISGGYPAVNAIVNGVTMRAGVNADVCNAHGAAYRCLFINNLIYGGTNLSGEEITFRGNKCFGRVQVSSGRNYIFENNDLPNFTFLTPDTNVQGNYLVVRNNIIRSIRLCYINASSTPYDTVYGFVCENNQLIISGTSRDGVICTVAYSEAGTVTFTGGHINNNNNSLNRSTGQIAPLPLTDNMAITKIGATEWDSVISNGLYIGVNAPSTNTIGARAYRSRLSVPIWYNGSAWVKADGTTP